jgi:hypothetical protein
MDVALGWPPSIRRMSGRWLSRGHAEVTAVWTWARPAGRRVVRDGSADVRIVERNGRLRRQGEQHDLDFVETVPQPDVAPANPAYPRSPEGPLDGLEVRWTRQTIGVAEGIGIATHGQRTFGAKLDQSAKLARIPGGYSSSSRHDSSPMPAMYRRKASVAAGDRNSPRSAQPIASRTSAASSGWGLQSLGAAFWAVSESMEAKGSAAARWRPRSLTPTPRMGHRGRRPKQRSQPGVVSKLAHFRSPRSGRRDLNPRRPPWQDHKTACRAATGRAN